MLIFLFSPKYYLQFTQNLYENVFFQNQGRLISNKFSTRNTHTTFITS